jgi:hypothetical protein
VTCPVDDIRKTRVLKTLFGGEVVHDTGDLVPHHEVPPC